MPNFISDADMAKMEGAQPKAVISDADMAKLEDAHSSGVIPEQYRGTVKGILNSLPTAGMLAGGGVGGLVGIGTTAGVAGPAGAVVGAGLGGAAGKSLQTLGEKYLLGEDKNRSDVYAQPVVAARDASAAELGGQALNIGAKAAADTPVGKFVGKGIDAVKDKLGNAAAKVGETFTGVPSQEIKTYAKDPSTIKQMAKTYDNNTAEAANAVRSKFSSDIQSTRQGLNSQISTALKNNTGAVDAKPILQSLEDAKSGIDADLYPEQRGQIDDLIQKVKTKINNNKQISVQNANTIKQFLQEKATTAYQAPGQIFSLGTKSAGAAKGGAAQARGLVNAAEPTVADANGTLSRLHDIEDTMNGNLISPEKPESALLAAGSGGNPRNAKSLEDLGKITGTDMLGDAQKLAAMRTFGSPKLMASDHTGKAVGRMILGAGAGEAAGGHKGALVGAMLTNPMALRTAIDSGLLTKEAMTSLMSNPETQGMIIKGLLAPSDDKAPEAAPGSLNPGLLTNTKKNPGRVGQVNQ